MKQFGRLLTAMVTPFTADGRVDYAQAKKLTKALLDSGSEGVVVSGTTGECPTLRNEEKLRLFSEVKSAAGKKAAVIAGSGSYCTEASIALTREVEKTGVDGCLVVVPYYQRYVGVEVHLLQDGLADDRVLLHLPAFFERQRTRL